MLSDLMSTDFSEFSVNKPVSNLLMVQAGAGGVIVWVIFLATLQATLVSVNPCLKPEPT